MIRYIYMIFFTLLSCENKKECNTSDLGNQITIVNWGISRIKMSDIKLYEYDSLFNQQIDKIKIDNVIVYDDSTLSNFKNLNILSEEHILSNKYYKLIIKDSLKYNIGNFKVCPEAVMIGSREDSICFLESYEINKIETKHRYHSPRLHIVVDTSGK
ncbi:hypothetical protein [Flavobacterium columnare]|nr:hypothetical protein [Flavobacterium columnare]